MTDRSDDYIDDYWIVDILLRVFCSSVGRIGEALCAYGQIEIH